MIDPDTIAALDALNDDGEADVVSEVFRLFLADVPARLDAIALAASAGDAAALRRAAHALKGSAANIGAIHVRDTCLALEQAAVAGRIDATMVAAVSGALPPTEAALRAIIAERTNVNA